LEKLTPANVQAMMSAKSAAGMAPKSVRHIWSLLCTALECAMGWELVSRNVAALAKPPRVPRREMKAFNQDEAKRFLGAIKGNRLEPLYLLTITLGLRRGEVLGLSWKDIDFASNTVHVRNALVRVGSHFELSETKTERSRRALPLLPFVARAL